MAFKSSGLPLFSIAGRLVGLDLFGLFCFWVLLFFRRFNLHCAPKGVLGRQRRERDPPRPARFVFLWVRHLLPTPFQESETIIAREEAKVNRTKAQLETLEEVRKELNGQATGPPSPSPAPPSTEMAIPDGLKPSRAILKLLRKHPNLDTNQIIRVLEPKVKSSAKNVRHNLRTTIFNLVRKGVVERDEAGRCRLAE